MPEAGEVCGVWAQSEDIWGIRDSFLYHYRDCREKRLGPEGLFDADTLVFVRLSLSKNEPRPEFNRERFIGRGDANNRGHVDWDGTRKWRVNRFAD